ncbi:MAG TPA: metallophosphoesterase [Candidatus Nanopelagicales bacterium]|nr:metallophosphoesterase [Candidatus Nanopelagicales bacterium]
MPRLSTTLLAAAGLGAAGLAYAVAEAHRYTLRRVESAVLPTGQPTLRVLHVSDMHITPRHRGREAWVRGLDALEPDLVVVTGDFLAHRDAVPTALSALGPLLERPGVFVLGSNDYYEPHPVNPARYLWSPSDLRQDRAMLPWGDLVKGLREAGWHDLSNSRAQLTVDGRSVDVRGVDDPHIGRDRYDEVAGPFDPSADVKLGVTHAPYLRVLDAMAADGAGLVLAGHTHGGQLAIPGYGALVTNCDLDRARAKGLSRHARPWDGTGDPGLGGADGRGAVLHVSAGLGTSPYAPVRFACPPEATLLTLTPMP